MGDNDTNKKSISCQLAFIEEVPDPPPKCFECPISLAEMNDPVTTTEGVTYERETLEEWIKKKGETPLSGKDTRIVKNIALKDAYETWKEMKIQAKMTDNELKGKNSIIQQQKKKLKHVELDHKLLQDYVETKEQSIELKEEIITTLKENRNRVLSENKELMSQIFTMKTEIETKDKSIEIILKEKQQLHKEREDLQKKLKQIGNITKMNHPITNIDSDEDTGEQKKRKYSTRNESLTDKEEEEVDDELVNETKNDDNHDILNNNNTICSDDEDIGMKNVRNKLKEHPLLKDLIMEGDTNFNLRKKIRNNNIVCPVHYLRIIREHFLSDEEKICYKHNKQLKHIEYINLKRAQKKEKKKIITRREKNKGNQKTCAL